MSDDQKPNEQPKPKNLVQKLCEVMKAVGYLQKKGDNEKQGYKYIREADVVAKMRDEFASRNIFIFPSLISHERHKLSKVEYDKVKETYVTDVVMRWTIVDGDSGEERICDIPGCSASPGDKGVYVCMTGSEKYLLMKGFLLPTGDDPENDENEEKGSKEAAQAVAERKIAEHKSKTAQVEVVKASVEAAKNDGLFDEVSGVIQGVRQMSTSAAKGNRPYRKIAMVVFENGSPIDIEISAFDNFKMSDTSCFAALDAAQTDDTAAFIVERSGKYLNLKDIKQLGSKHWDARLAITQR